MARTSDETLSTSWGRPFSLARYISPSNSSRTGQKSFSKASRLENICISPNPQDAIQLSNERLTTGPGSRGGRLIDPRESERRRCDSLGSERVCLHPTGHRLPDGWPGIFLNEMRARYGDFGLVFPTSAEIPDSTDQDRAGFGVDEQFWDVVLRHPLRIVGSDLHHVGGFACYRNLPRPGQRRPAVPGFRKGAAIFRHLGLGQFPQDRPRQYPLDEHVALEDHRLAFVGAKALKDRRRRRTPFVPGSDGPHDPLHIGNAADTIAVMIGPVETERRAPIVHHEHDGFRNPYDRIDEGFEKFAVGRE